jgi:hypothetical protein
MADAPEPVPESITLPVVWVGLDDAPVMFANSLIVQHSAENEFLLSFGQLSPPPLLADTPEARHEQAQQVGYIPIKPVVRLGMNRQRVQELVDALQQNLRTHDARESW